FAKPEIATGSPLATVSVMVSVNAVRNASVDFFSAPVRSASAATSSLRFNCLLLQLALVRRASAWHGGPRKGRISRHFWSSPLEEGRIAAFARARRGSPGGRRAAPEP